MSLRKMATREAPHATYVAGDWTYLVLKVMAPKKSPADQYVAWHVAVKSPYTFGSFEQGDNYSAEIVKLATLESATAEFIAYLNEHGVK